MEEAFLARRPARRLLVVPNRRAALEKLVLHATNLRIPIVEVEGGSLTAIAGFDGHQGIALVVEPRTWASVDDVLARARERGEPPLILVLDSLEDPQNVGTLLRSAEAAGVHGAIFPTHRQAPLSPAAVKASAGATEHLALAPVDDLPGALADLRAKGVRVVGADGDAPLAARTADLRGPLAIIVGSEGRGLSPAVRRRTDQLVRIPMHGRIGSLNAAVAGSVLLYEATAQRDPSGTGRTQRPAVAPERIDDADAESPEDPPTDTPEPVAEAVIVASPKRVRRPKAEPPADPAPAPAPGVDAELLPGGPPEAVETPVTAPPVEPPKRARRARTSPAATTPAEPPPDPPKPARRSRKTAATDVAPPSDEPVPEPPSS